MSAVQLPADDGKSKHWLRRFLPFIIFVLLVGLMFVGLSLNPKLVPSPFIGKPAPEFVLPVLGKPGATLSHENLKGDITLLNVWASWCVSCRVEHAAITELSERGIRIIGLNYKDDPADALAWLAQFGNPYIASAVDRDGRIGIDWGVYGAPETFVIDKEGIVRYKHIGPVSMEDIHTKFMPLIDKLKSESAG